MLKATNTVLSAAFTGLLFIGCPVQSASAETPQTNLAGQVIENVLNTVILPNHAAFAEVAASQADKWTAFCSKPTTDGLDRLQTAYQETVRDFSRIELYRFGPARSDNLFQRLFYWPDRKGRGLKQVQRLLSGKDQTAATGDALRGKSVAVQGLPALEFILYGTGAETLMDTGSFRCTYGTALAATIAKNASILSDRWASPTGYARLMMSSGPENTLYRDQGEVFQEFLRAAREQLQVIDQLKLGSVLGASLEKSKPKRAPFWRSNLTILNIRENLAAVDQLVAAVVTDLLSDKDGWQMDSFAFQFREIRKVLDNVEASGTPWVNAVGDPEIYEKLTYGRLPVQGAETLVGDSFASSLGLSLGFNSLDGD